MKNDVGPAAATSRANDSFTPRTTDDNATTTNTPTATPRMVSAARPLFERIESSAMLTPSNARVIPAASFMSLVAALRSDRAGRHAGHDADDRAEQRRHHQRPRGNGRRQRRLHRDDLGGENAERDADHGAN